MYEQDYRIFSLSNVGFETRIDTDIWRLNEFYQRRFGCGEDDEELSKCLFLGIHLPISEYWWLSISAQFRMIIDFGLAHISQGLASISAAICHKSIGAADKFLEHEARHYSQRSRETQAKSFFCSFH